MVAQEVPCVQLEVFEVERRLGFLRGGVCVSEAPQELFEERAVACGKLVERRLLDGVARLLVAGEAVTRATAGSEIGEVDQPVGGRRALEELDRPRRVLPRRLGLLQSGRVFDDAARRLAQLLDPVVEPRPVGDLEDEVTARRAQRLVHPGQHPAQGVGAVRRQQPDPLGITGRAEALERLLERLAGEYPRLVLVQHAETRVDAGLEGMGLEQAMTEAVDRRDPGAVQLPRQVMPAELGKPLSDSAAQLACGALGVRDREHRVDGQAAVANRSDEALDDTVVLPVPAPAETNTARPRRSRRAVPRSEQYDE